MALKLFLVKRVTNINPNNDQLLLQPDQNEKPQVQYL